MLKFLKRFLMLSLFTLAVLVLGNWIRIGNKTISDQVKTEISHAERSDLVGKVRDWAGKIADDVRTGSQKKSQLLIEAIPAQSSAVSNSLSNSKRSLREILPPSERQKLKALIRELNSPASTGTN